MSKHTPGPWAWFHQSLWNDDLEVSILGCCDYSLAKDVVDEGPEDDSYWVPSEADKRLIAAAPCLYAAAELALANLLRNLASEEATGQPFMGDDEHEAISVLRAAIAKATGAQP